MYKGYFHHLFFLAVFALFALPAHSTQNAPQTRAGSVSGCPGTEVTIPVTVANFDQISAISLRLDFNPTELTFVSLTDMNPAITGAMVNSVLLSPTLKKIMFSWSSVGPVNLNDESVLFKLNFTLITGNPAVVFNNTASGGGECEYADVNGDALNDLPSANFFYGAQVTNLALPQPGNIAGISSVCQGQNGVSYSIDPVANATGYLWALPTGATITAGENTNTIEVSFLPGTQSGNIIASATNTCGTSAPSEAFWIQVDSPPAQPAAISGPANPEEGSLVTYETNTVEDVTYFWEVPADWSISAGQYSGTITALTGSSSGIVRVTPSNNCGDGPARLLEVSVSGEKTLNLQVMLEGLYNPATGLMNKARNEAGDQYPGDIADMLVVELHQATAPFSILNTGVQASLLTGGDCTIELGNVASSSYYIVIKHRNHLETWSAAPVSFAGSFTSYNFTFSKNQAFGSNQKMLNASVAGLFCGDTDGSGHVDASDMNTTAAMASQFLTGYLNNDVNGDGAVDALDLIVIDNQIATGVEVARP